MGSSIHREFLGWQRPALATAAEYLLSAFAREHEWDLGGVIVVVPGGRAGHRLREILVALAEERQLDLTPPDIVTEQDLPERLYQPRRPLADVLTQHLAWVAALREMPATRLAPFLPHPPAANDTLRWLAVAQTLRGLHKELAADGIACPDVLNGAAKLEGFIEHDRWETLCKLQRAYLDVLDRLQLWDAQTARLVAIEKREIATEQRIVLLGMVDLNRAQRQMLDQIAERVTAFVVAPSELADRFDAHGCLIPEQWTEMELPLADEQIERVDGPADQAEAVTRWLAALGGRYRADQITVGLPDERLAPQIERQLEQLGVRARFAIAKKLPETGPYRLLQIAAEYAARGRFRDLTALVRHPDVFEWLAGRVRAEDVSASDILLTLDNFASERLPARLDPDRLAKEPEQGKLLAIHRAAAALVAPLTGAAQPLAAWAEPLRRVLIDVYGGRTLDRRQEADRYLLEALEFMQDALGELAAVPEAIQPALDAQQACRLVLDALSSQGIAPPADPDAIELLGWLELPLDDAPALAVTTFNEGFVPSAMSADSFLPNRLRRHLGLLDNDRRLARDAYALSVLLASRENLRLIVTHRDAEGNPLAPSRLLFATDPDGVVSRALKFFGDLPPTPPRRNLLADKPRDRSTLVPPRPRPLKTPITELSVTKFRDYIACPYRFYLRHIAQLESLADAADELDGGAFGDLVHLVLEQFGRSSEARGCDDPQQIAAFLEERLYKIAAARYGGKNARAAVHVQIEQARLRLAAFAEWQARRIRDGWQIVFSEDTESKQRTLTAPFPAGDEPFTLRGRIDRIDYHAGERVLAVLDYKTADAGLSPQQTHLRSGEWIDLQLPLYRHLLAAVKLPAQREAIAKVELGYILLPKDSGGVKHALAEWDDTQLQAADARARQIIADIRAEKFWPPLQPPPLFCEDLAAICQDRALGQWRAAEGDAA